MGYANSVGEKEILSTSAKAFYFSKYWLLVITRDAKVRMVRFLDL